MTIDGGLKGIVLSHLKVDKVRNDEMVTLNLTDQEAEYIIKLLINKIDDKIDNASSTLVDYGPGPQTLIDGSFDSSGFFGFVDSFEFFTREELDNILGLHKGVAINSNNKWFKFWDHGKVLFVPMKPLRHSLSWDDIDDVDAVYGTIVNNGNYQFNCRLLTGGTTPEDKDNEWDRLMVPLNNGQWANYSDEALGFNYQNGGCSWTQTVPDGFPSYRVTRGHARLARWSRAASSNGDSSYGWRPCLELR